MTNDTATIPSLSDFESAHRAEKHVRGLIDDLESVLEDAAKSVLNLGAYRKVRHADVAIEFATRSAERLAVDFDQDLVEFSARCLQRLFVDDTYRREVLAACKNCDDTRDIFCRHYATMLAYRPGLVTDRPGYRSIHDHMTDVIAAATRRFLASTGGEIKAHMSV